MIQNHQIKLHSPQRTLHNNNNHILTEEKKDISLSNQLYPPRSVYHNKLDVFYAMQLIFKEANLERAMQNYICKKNQTKNYIRFPSSGFVCKKQN